MLGNLLKAIHHLFRARIFEVYGMRTVLGGSHIILPDGLKSAIEIGIARRIRTGDRLANILSLHQLC
jgi:hypothetical protein